jgi:hypothetical protein
MTILGLPAATCMLLHVLFSLAGIGSKFVNFSVAAQRRALT